MIDSFGVRLYFENSINFTDRNEQFYDDPSINLTNRYEKFYDDPSGGSWRPFYSDKEHLYHWLIKYATVNNRSPDEKKGFILNNGTFERFEPIGITWNDSYCRRIKDAGPSGCFVERNLSTIFDFNYQGNNCRGKDFTTNNLCNPFNHDLRCALFSPSFICEN